MSGLIERLEAGETLESIIAWGDQTFGPCSQERAIERAGEEWAEMEEDDADVPIEAADVIICLLRIPGILDAINRKMTINRGRTWDVRPDGTGYHVKQPKCQCGRPATTKYDGDMYCEPCARYSAQREAAKRAAVRPKARARPRQGMRPKPQTSPPEKADE